MIVKDKRLVIECARMNLVDISLWAWWFEWNLADRKPSLTLDERWFVCRARAERHRWVEVVCFYSGYWPAAMFSREYSGSSLWVVEIRRHHDRWCSWHKIVFERLGWWFSLEMTMLRAGCHRTGWCPWTGNRADARRGNKRVNTCKWDRHVSHLMPEDRIQVRFAGDRTPVSRHSADIVRP